MDSSYFQLGTPTPAEEVGYARVSDADDQDPDFQIALLKKRGIPDDNIFVDKASGRTMARPRLRKALMLMEGRPGWTLVVYKLDRLGRDALGLMKLAREFEEKGWNLVSITEQMDTRTPLGRCFFGMMALLAQLESDLISERTKAGVARRRERGLPVGKPAKFDSKTVEAIQKAIETEPRTLKSIAEQFGCSPQYINAHWPRWRSRSVADRRDYRRRRPVPTND